MHYCTFFDHRYIARGLVMIRSLRQAEPDAQIWVLCLDSIVDDIIAHLAEPGVHPISMANFEIADPELAAARNDGRSLVEYYFSLKASLILMVMGIAVQAERITYLDSDLLFFGSLQPVFAENSLASVLLTPHRFAAGLQAMTVFGRYNAGWLSFRRDAQSLDCLTWWRARCLEWCRDHVDEAGGRYADQRYLDRFEFLFAGVHAICHKGANLAPWNLAGSWLSLEAGRLIVDGTDPLIFFHVHGLKYLGRHFYLSPADTFGSGPDRFIQQTIYRPYLAVVQTTERELIDWMPQTDQPLRPLARNNRNVALPNLKQGLRVALAALRGHVISFRC